MKKLLSVLLILALCAVCALAEEEEKYLPSKTTGDMTVITATAENMPDGASFTIKTVPVEDMNEEQQELITAEPEKLKEAASVEKYFAGAVDAKGNPVDLKALVGTDDLKVFEFMLLSCEGYETEYGTVNLTLQFATPYEKDDVVAVMVGLPGEDGEVNWVAYEGKVIDDEGRIQVEMDPETVDAIQNNCALLAIVSK